MLAAYFGEDQFGAVGVVEAAKVGVHPSAAGGLVDGHASIASGE
jgi:hypothetical protein